MAFCCRFPVSCPVSYVYPALGRGRHTRQPPKLGDQDPDELILETNHLETNHLEPNHLETNHLETNHLETNHLEPNHLETNHLELFAKNVKFHHFQLGLTGFTSTDSEAEVDTSNLLV